MADDLGVRTIDLQRVITGYVLKFCAMLGVVGMQIVHLHEITAKGAAVVHKDRLLHDTA